VEPGTLVLRVPMPCGLWRRWLRWEPVLFVRVTLALSQAPGKRLTGVAVEGWPSGCGHRRGARLLGEICRLLIDDMRGYLQPDREGRTRKRQPYDCPV